MNEIEQKEIVKIITTHSCQYVDYDEESPFDSRRIVEPYILAKALYNAGLRFIKRIL